MICAPGSQHRESDVVKICCEPILGSMIHLPASSRPPQTSRSKERPQEYQDTMSLIIASEAPASLSPVERIIIPPKNIESAPYASRGSNAC